MKGKEKTKREEYQKSKRKVVLSVLALVVCVAMLLGTTLAWFTDSVTSGRNKIVAGDLDIEAYHTSGKVKDPQKIDINTLLFTDVELWEPGAVDYENINIKNVGTVAAKVKLQVLDVAKNMMKEGNYDLTQVIQIAVKEGGFTGEVSRESILSDPDVQFETFKGFEKTFALPAGAGEGSEKTYGIALYWKPTDSDNNWNANNGKETSDGLPLWIEFGLSILATQNTVEADSFDHLYDENATYPILAPVVEDIATEEIETTGQEVEITNEAGTSIIPAAEENVQIVASTKVNEPTTEKNNYEMQKDGNLTRYFATTDSTADSVTYDISYIYTEEGNSYNVSEFKGVVTNILTVSTGLKNVRITHSHAGTSTEMTKTDNPDLGTDGYFYYNDTNGILKIWSKKYSEFTIRYDTEFAAAVDGQGFMSLKAALAAAADGKVVTLLKDVSEEGLVIDKTIALKGEGKKITANGDAITIAANGVFLDKVSAVSANGIALVVNENATDTIVTRGSYQSGTAAVGKQGEGAIRFMGGNGDISVTKASLLGGLHVLNYVSGTLTVSENTFAVDASLAERTDIVCGLLAYGSGAQALTSSGESYLNGNTFSESTANYKVLIQDDKWKTCYSDKCVAKIGTTAYFETLDAAIKAAADGDTITLLKDIDLKESIEVRKVLTIDRAGFELDGDKITVPAGGIFTKTDEDGILKITSNDPAVVVHAKNAEWTTGTAYSTFGDAVNALDADNMCITIRKSIDAKRASTSSFYNIKNTIKNLTIRVEEGAVVDFGSTVNNVIEFQYKNSAGYLYFEGAGTVKFTPSGDYGLVMFENKGRLVITDTCFDASSGTGYLANNYTSITINSGKYKNIGVASGTSCTISDGMFTQDLSAFVVEGKEFTAIQDPVYKYKVGPLTPEKATFAVIGTSTTLYYTTFNGAVTNAVDGNTIKFLKDYTMATNTIQFIQKKLTVDLDGHTLNGNRQYGLFGLSATKIVTFKNGTINNNNTYPDKTIASEKFRAIDVTFNFEKAAEKIDFAGGSTCYVKSADGTSFTSAASVPEAYTAKLVQAAANGGATRYYTNPSAITDAFNIVKNGDTVYMTKNASGDVSVPSLGKMESFTVVLEGAATTFPSFKSGNGEVTASSQDPVTRVFTVTPKMVCQIGTTKYSTLQEGLNALSANNSTLELLDDVTITSTLRRDGSSSTSKIANNRTYYIDYKGHTITADKCTAFSITGNDSNLSSSVYFKDTVGGGGITLTNATTSYYCVTNGNKVKLFIQSGMYNAGNGNLYNLGAYTKSEVSGGTFSKEPKNNIAVGYKVVQNAGTPTTWSVVKTPE